MEKVTLALCCLYALFFVALFFKRRKKPPLKPFAPKVAEFNDCFHYEIDLMNLEKVIRSAPNLLCLSMAKQQIKVFNIRYRNKVNNTMLILATNDLRRMADEQENVIELRNCMLN